MVIVVDQSGSMRESDVVGTRSRSDAVWVTLALDVIGNQLRSGNGTSSDIVTIIGMNDIGSWLVNKKPLDWILFNEVVNLGRYSKPRSHGHYIPALDLASAALFSNLHGQCALVLTLLSDGRPSDHTSACGGSVTEQLVEKIGTIASHFGRRLSVGMIGFGTAPGEFATLKAMSNAAKDYGSIGTFEHVSLSTGALGKAMSSLTTTLTNTKTEMTVFGGSVQRTVRQVTREHRSAGVFDDRSETDNSKWWEYNDFSRFVWGSGHQKDKMKKVSPIDPRAFGVAMKIPIIGEGAERMVHKFREYDAKGNFVGPYLVAKESRFTEDVESATSLDQRKSFHQTFLATQSRAQTLAHRFNDKMKGFPGERQPQVTFLACSVYTVNDPKHGNIGVLVEKRLDPAHYKKYNSNNGYVREDSDSDLLQAFSHFTHNLTKRKLLVCDLQGVLDTSKNPHVFELTDPVIHNHSKQGHRHVYGRTDRGPKGISEFFHSHTCNDICKRLSLPSA
jgi:hypothetical protein